MRDRRTFPPARTRASRVASPVMRPKTLTGDAATGTVPVLAGVGPKKRAMAGPCGQ